MMRKLAIALSLVGAMGTGTATALGLGEATVKSALNQPLSAEIELVNIRDLEQNEILPGLASREDFAKANVERVFLLSNIRFDVTKNEQGRSVIKLTTKKPIREPFLNFLVEVIWPSGRLLREYALLIDPPVFSEDQASSIVPATVTVDRSVVQVPDVYGRDAADTDVVSMDGLPPIEVVNDGAAGDTYGPTIQSDTLWAIALKVRPSRSMTPQQVMLAIQDNNPEAFVDGNINRLKAGYVLRLPSEDQVSGRSVSQAVREVVSQNRALERGESVAKRTIDATESKTTTSMSPGGSEKAGDELKIVVADNADSDTASGTHAGSSSQGGGSSSDIAVAMEKLDKSERENDELTGRVKDLEDQLQTLQRLLSLKDDQLSELQRQMGKVDEMQSDVADNAMSGMDQAGEAMPSGDMSPEEGSSGDAISDLGAEEVPGTDGVAPEADTAETMPESVDDSDEMAGTESVAAKPEKIKPKQIVKTAPAEPAPKEESLLDTILGNPLYLGGIGAGALLLVLGLIALSRHNAKKEQAFHESLALQGDDEDEVFELGDESHEAEDVEGESEVKEEAEDPISEADVYIAYGRLDQAATVLESGISNEPSRTDIRLKLLDVYKQSNDTESFFKQYKEVEALDDEEALAAADALKAGMVEPDDGETEISIDDLEKDLLGGGFDSSESLQLDEVEDEVSETETVADSMDFDSTIVETPPVEEEVVDLDFDDLDLDEEVDEASQASPLEQIDEIDLESEETLEDEFAGIELESEEASVDLEEEIDLEDLDKSLDEFDEDLDADLASLDSELDEDLGDLDLESDEDDDFGSLGEASESTLEEDLEESDLSELDASLDEDLDLDLSDEMEEALAEDEIEESIEEDEVSLEDDLSLDDLDAELDADLESLEIESDESEDIDDLVEELEEVAKDLSSEDLTTENDLEAALGGVSDELEELELDESLDEDLDLDLGDDLDTDSLVTADDDEIAALESVDAADEDSEDDEDFDFLSGTDEAATKLDLARAYIDMGDTEGAKDILEEVTLEGSEEQQNEAKNLLKDLD